MAQDYEIGLAVNEIVDLTDGEVTFGGGGKGQLATVVWNPNGGDTVETAGRGPSRLAAVQALLANVKAAAIVVTKISADDPTPIEDESESRPTVEDVLALIGDHGHEPEIHTPEPDDDKIPGPKWKGTQLVGFSPCVGECMMSIQDLCDCRCMGANHGIGYVLAAIAAGADLKSALQQHTPTMYGAKKCACGCGGETLRRFVPGHDARLHAREKREREAAARGITVDEYIVAHKRELAEASKARKAAKAA